MLETITANWFKSGNSWALRLPRGFRLPGDSVTIRRDADRLIVAAQGHEWDDFFTPDAPRVTADFNPARDAAPPQARELF
jgi:antitoxin VapB